VLSPLPLGVQQHNRVGGFPQTLTRCCTKDEGSDFYVALIPQEFIMVLMEEVFQPLSNAGHVLATYERFAEDPILLLEAKRQLLPQDLLQLFAQKPPAEQVECARHIRLQLPGILEFAFAICEACFLEAKFDTADLLLERALSYHLPGSEESCNIMDKRLSIVERLINKRDFCWADLILERISRVHPNSLEALTALFERRMALVDQSFDAQQTRFALVILERLYDFSPLNSLQERIVAEKCLSLTTRCLDDGDFELCNQLLHRIRPLQKHTSGTDMRIQSIISRLGSEQTTIADQSPLSTLLDCCRRVRAQLDTQHSKMLDRPKPRSV
jgi:hypothetical protein